MSASQVRFFITGTGTEVGKTVVTGALARFFFRSGYCTKVCKPFASGGIPSPDAVTLAACLDGTQSAGSIAPVSFVQPLAPYTIVREYNGSLDIGAALNDVHQLGREADVLLVEGIGGVMVPLLRTYSVIDFIAELQYPVLVVADAGLGTINHTVMTLAMLKARRVPVAGFVANHRSPGGADISTDTNPAIISELTGVPCLGVIPYITGAEETICEQVEKSIEHIADKICSYARVRMAGSQTR